jgi:hypothetical protein
MIMLRATVAPDGHIQVLRHGRVLTDAEFNSLCSEAKKQKKNLQLTLVNRSKSEDAVRIVLLEARCAGATHIGFSGIDQYPESGPPQLKDMPDRGAKK